MTSDTVQVLATTAPTLGLDGPRFLQLYGVLLVLVSLAVWLRHRVVYAGVVRRSSSLRPVDYRLLGPSELAFLAGGPRRAMLTAVTVLLERGILEPQATHGATGSEYERFVVRRAPHPTDALDPLQQAVVEHCARTEGVGFDDLRTACAEPLDRLRESLEQRGLAFTPATHKRADALDKLYYLLVALLVFRLVTGLINDKPVGFLILTAVVTLVVAAFATGSRSRVRKAGRLLLAARTDLAHLGPDYRPAYRAYGPLALPAAVALFGVGALTVAYPMIAGNELVTTLAMHGAGSGSAGYGTGCGTTGSGCSSSSDSASGGGDGGGGCGGGGCGGCGG